MSPWWGCLPVHRHGGWEGFAHAHAVRRFSWNCNLSKAARRGALSNRLCPPHAQAGLSALKTPQSLQDSCSREDPLHLAAFRTLAQELPFAKHVHSKLVCAVTREIIDEHNPPMVGAQALRCAQGSRCCKWTVHCPSASPRVSSSERRCAAPIPWFAGAAQRVRVQREGGAAAGDGGGRQGHLPTHW